MIVERIGFQPTRNGETMADLPPLYKYLNVQGARLTLGNRTFTRYTACGAPSRRRWMKWGFQKLPSRYASTTVTDRSARA
jgi:hypothetical protein